LDQVGRTLQSAQRGEGLGLEVFGVAGTGSPEAVVLDVLPDPLCAQESWWLIM
jgi:hypothetical protein